MLRSTHVNMTLSAWLWAMIVMDSFSLHMFFLSIYAIVQDWDHHAGFMKWFFWFSLPFKHRWFTHTLLFILLFILLVNIAIFIYKFWLVVPTMSELNLFIESFKVDNIFLFILLHGHLAWDFLTKRGIPYLYPIFKWNIGIGLVSTGDRSDGTVSGEMVINFMHSILNVYLISYIIINFDRYSQIIQPHIQSITESWDVKTILLLGFLEIIFIIVLFWKDIKNYIKHFSSFMKRLIKVITLSAIGWGISAVIVLVLMVFNINLTDVLAKISNNTIIIEWLNTYFIITLMWILLIFSLYLTKRYIVSLATTISYFINVTYILLWLSLFLILN